MRLRAGGMNGGKSSEFGISLGYTAASTAILGRRQIISDDDGLSHSLRNCSQLSSAASVSRGAGGCGRRGVREVRQGAGEISMGRRKVAAPATAACFASLCLSRSGDTVHSGRGGIRTLVLPAAADIACRGGDGGGGLGVHALATLHTGHPPQRHPQPSACAPHAARDGAAAGAEYGPYATVARQQTAWVQCSTKCQEMPNLKDLSLRIATPGGLAAAVMRVHAGVGYGPFSTAGCLTSAR
jgi:hypothetical protein